jgi:pilus assembly protein CpaD
MASRKTLAILLAFGAIAGAGTAHAAPESNHGLNSPNQPVVRRTDFALDLNAGNGLAPSEQGRLDAWFHSLGLGYGDRIFVDGDSGYGRTRADVAAVAADYGLLLSDGAPITAGAPPPGTVRIVVSRSTASVPNCPVWRGHDSPTETSANYGCAINSNLAAMVADPNDLVLGQAGSAVSNAATAAKAIKTYREAPPTGAKGLIDTSTTGSH